MWANNHYGPSTREIEFLLGIVEITIFVPNNRQHMFKLMLVGSLVVCNVKTRRVQVLGGVNKQFLNTSSDSLKLIHPYTICEHLVMVIQHRVIIVSQSSPFF
jgi:hypothetical protein